MLLGPGISARGSFSWSVTKCAPGVAAQSRRRFRRGARAGSEDGESYLPVLDTVHGRKDRTPARELRAGTLLFSLQAAG
jgi:hypothetical protein